MTFIKNIFNKSGNIKHTDFSVLNADMHSHLIPGIDDGSQSIEESLDLIKKLYHLGYKKLITTPHVIGDKYNNTPETISSEFAKLETAVKNTGIPITLGYAGEYLIDDKFEERMKSGTLLTFGKKYILIELPFIHEPENLLSLVFNLQMNGYKVVLAHTERYSYWYGNQKKYEELHDREIYLQMNITSLTGYYSIPTKRAAEWLIDSEMISFLGTDAHNSAYLDEITKSINNKYLQKILSSGKLLNSTL